MNKTHLALNKTLKSRKNSIKQVEPLIFEVKDKVALKDETCYNLLITLTEAVANAIFHGNNGDSSKNVYINVSVTDNQIIMTVEDEGNGFDPDAIDDPRKPENLMKAKGRGVFLIKALADDVKFDITDTGTKITIIFNY